jgi:RES domain-containing protein
LTRAWRLVASKFADRIFSGGSAYRQGGRWNSPGRAVVYMSENLSLCTLESLVHMVQMPMMNGFKYVWVDIPKELITDIGIMDLPADWSAVPAQRSTRQIGDRWFDSRSYPVLKVPSTVIPVEHNYAINPSHPDFKELRIGGIRDFEFDARLLKTLKKSSQVRME